MVLTARGVETLDDVVREIRQAGGAAVGIAGDVSNPDHIDALARLALDTWGRIDTWINNAAVFIQGRVEDITPEEYRRVLEIDLFGVMWGTRRAIEQMRQQGSGVIVQVSSILGRRGAAYFSAYAAAKQGITGFTESARAELWGSGVRIATLYLPTVDTPIYQHARGKFGTQPKPAPPVTVPERAAKAITRLAESGDVRRYIGFFRVFYLGMDRVSPRLADWMLHRTAQFTRTDTPSDGDNLFEPTAEPRIRGGWADQGWRGFTLAETARVLPVETALGAAALGAAGVLLAARLLRA